ncbi:MAG: acyl-ACP--UDP-N-acetylglucosamine O-acyltransferase [Rubrivivax sp.]
MAQIHPTAIVDPAADLDGGVAVGPYAVIGAGVRVGAGTTIGAHCVLEGPMTIGLDNRIHPHAVLGGAPQDMKYRGVPTSLAIGDRNTIREFCTFNRGTAQDGGTTRVGDDNWIMAYVHVAHDVQLGSHTILANNATLAGHVHVGDWAIVGGLVGVHQFCRVGAHAMVGFQSRVSQDVPPFMTVAGQPLAVAGINAEGLRRRGYSRLRIDALRRAHRLLYREGRKLDDARAALEEMARSAPESEPDLRCLIDFLAASTRGIVRPGD